MNVLEDIIVDNFAALATDSTASDRKTLICQQSLQQPMKYISGAKTIYAGATNNMDQTLTNNTALRFVVTHEVQSKYQNTFKLRSVLRSGLKLKTFDPF